MESSKKFVQRQLGDNSNNDDSVEIDCFNDETDDDVVTNGNLPVPFVKWAGARDV